MTDPKSGLNVNATAFVPRVSAAAFVPGQPVHVTPNPPQQQVPPPQTANAPPPRVITNGIGPQGQQNVNSKSPSSDQVIPNKSAQPTQEIAKNHDEKRQSEPEVKSDDSSQSTPRDEEKRQISEATAESGGGETDRQGQGDTWEEGEGDAEEEDDEEERVKPKASKKVKPGEEGKGPRKDHINVVFIGHVDAGKSTIGGHIMFLTGMVDKRTLEKYEREAKEKNRESWYLSWALDTNAEERDKGKTVEVGRAYFETEKKHFTILDAPGHKSFVPNMIGGASQADLAVLVISARKGEFETGFERGGQTREHAMLVKTAGVKQLVVLVNKMDDPTVEWAEDRFNEIKDGLTPYLKKVGFNPKTDLVYIPCSGLSGAFLKEPASPDCCPWYREPCLIQYLDDLPPFSRSRDGPVRVVLADKYSDMGTIVMGKIESGLVSKGATLTLMPNRCSVQVTQMWSDEIETDEAEPGENVKLKVKGIEEDQILPGFVLCSQDNLCHVGRVFDAQVVILEHKSIICPGYGAVLHAQSAVEEITVQRILCIVDKKSGEKTKAKFVKQDQISIMRLESAEMFCLEAFKDFPQMGRFTLRDEGRTIAIGKVLKVIE